MTKSAKNDDRATKPPTVGPTSHAWHLAVLLCAIAAGGFYVLHLKVGAQPRFSSAATRLERSSLALEAEHG